MIKIQILEEFTPIQQQIIDVLRKNGEMSRNEICEKFGYKTHIYNYIVLSPNRKQYPQKLEQYHKRTTIYDNLVKLEKKGIVERFRRNNGKVGASVKMWKLTTSNQSESKLKCKK